MTDPKPNIRPGVRAICRNGFWTPTVLWDEHRHLWFAGDRVWFVDGKYHSMTMSSEWDIIGIVEDLPTVPSQKPAPQIPGMPEGWEAVSVRSKITTFDRELNPVPGHQLLVEVRRIKPPEPVCTWQHGQLKDGWWAQDEDGLGCWHEDQPIAARHRWESGGIQASMEGLVNPPNFRDNLPWDQRIVKVGPEAERGMHSP